MKLVSRYVRENKRYTQRYLMDLFLLSENEFNKFKTELFSKGILKVHDSTDENEVESLLEDDLPENPNNTNTLYYFKYVGVVLCCRRVIKVYPKCYYSILEPVTDRCLEKRMKVVLKVIQKYNIKKAKEYRVQTADIGDKYNNLLGLMVYLMNDFFDFGLYSNDEEIVELNGEGIIMWGKSVDECIPIIENNIPYYVDTYCVRYSNDESDYFRLLHAYVLTECSRQMENAGLLDLLGFEKIDLSENEQNDFGQLGYILQKIVEEQDIQYETRKKQLLNAIYVYLDLVNNSKITDYEDSFKMYGTNAFYKVWEEMCQCIFGNMLEENLASLPIKLVSGDNPNAKLISIIDKPLWTSGKTKEYAKKTLEPDLITISDINGNQAFVIMDAKYYNLKLDDGVKLHGNPGVGDVTKQYLYQLAYKDFLANHRINMVKNCLLMPTEQEETVIKGKVEISFLSTIPLEDIKIRFLSIDKMMDAYLSNSLWPISYLELEK